MKNLKSSIFGLALLFASFSSYSQDTTSMVRRLTSTDVANIEVAKNYSNGDEIDEFVLSDGSVIKSGSTLIFGKPINNSKSYTRIYFGYVTLGKALLVTPQPMPDGWVGHTVIVQKLKVSHQKMTANSALNVLAYVQDPNVSAGLGANNRTIMGLEMAISTGEVVNPNAAITREAAIAKLKEGKDLLELGLMTSAEYEKLKAQLTPIITGNK
jgi:hypothetical protein